MRTKSFNEITNGTQFRLVKDTNASIYTKQGKNGLLNGPEGGQIKIAGSTTVHTL